MLEGSTGELFPPKQLRNSISLFTPDMCRSIPFDYEKDVEILGVTGYRFTAGDRAVDNGMKYPENSCYNGDNGEAVPSGVMNISSCRYGSPVFMSYPHYFGADPFYLDEVDGMQPSKEEHESFFTLEPVSYNTFALSFAFMNKIIPLDDWSSIRDYNSFASKLLSSTSRRAFNLSRCSSDVHSSDVVWAKVCHGSRYGTSNKNCCSDSMDRKSFWIFAFKRWHFLYHYFLLSCILPVEKKVK